MCVCVCAIPLNISISSRSQFGDLGFFAGGGACAFRDEPEAGAGPPVKHWRLWL